MQILNFPSSKNFGLSIYIKYARDEISKMLTNLEKRLERDESKKFKKQLSVL